VIVVLDLPVLLVFSGKLHTTEPDAVVHYGPLGLRLGNIGSGSPGSNVVLRWSPRQLFPAERGPGSGTGARIWVAAS